MKRADIVHLMNPLDVKGINRFISPGKEIQPHKGVQVGKVRRVKDDDGSVSYWGSITFPKWVVMEDSESKTYRFACTKDGVFLGW